EVLRSGDHEKAEAGYGRVRAGDLRVHRVRSRPSTILPRLQLPRQDQEPSRSRFAKQKRMWFGRRTATSNLGRVSVSTARTLRRRRICAGKQSDLRSK